MTTASSVRIVERGFAVLPANVNLTGTVSGAWQNSGCEVTLTAAGAYHLDAVVRATLNASDGTNVWIGARLFDVTAGAVVPNSEALVYQIANSVSPTTTVVTEGGNQAVPIAVPYTVPGPRVIRIQVVKNYTGPAPATAQVISDANGRTTLRYERIA
ncbi:hypothetical protein [Streptomyces misionensis]|uniref:hypothetical protein n=1 Tax=Streptomyces misionensis TaxID=67331 RepID=UPI0033B750CE